MKHIKYIIEDVAPTVAKMSCFVDDQFVFERFANADTHGYVTAGGKPFCRFGTQAQLQWSGEGSLAKFIEINTYCDIEILANPKPLFDDEEKPSANVESVNEADALALIAENERQALADSLDDANTLISTFFQMIADVGNAAYHAASCSDSPERSRAHMYRAVCASELSKALRAAHASVVDDRARCFISAVKHMSLIDPGAHYLKAPRAS